MSAVHKLATARAALVSASERAEAAHDAHSKLLVRKSECDSKASEAIRDAHDGKIDEATAALRMSIASHDSKDIQALLDQSAPVLSGLNQEVAHAQAVCAEAEKAMKREEWQMAANDLDRSLKEIEETFLAALAERAHLAYLLTGKVSAASSMFSYWQPTAELSQSVTRFIAPAQRKV
ncbi:cob(I)alamin adenosyltransferase [Paraburkholderia sp. GAS199]|uniref:hypothetical protein n=1 Tax=Paraburkholderia sp. GAS199 TaxID=3035126 RepID=UPI003D191408